MQQKGSVFLPAGRRHYRIKYYVDGRPVKENTGCTDERKAHALLNKRLAAIDAGVPIAAAQGKVRWDEAVKALETNYANKEHDSWDDTRRRLALHLTPVFTGKRLASIGPSELADYIAKRKQETYVPGSRWKDGQQIAKGHGKPRRYSNAQINRELAIIRRMMNLARKQGKLLYVPAFEMLSEKGRARKGFVSREDHDAIARHLHQPYRDIADVGYITGWRIDSEVMPLEWRHVEFKANELRLDPEMSKNDDGRVFVMTDDLRRILLRRKAEHDARCKAGQICPQIFVRMVAKGRGGPKEPRPAKAFWKAYDRARAKAHVRRMPHDYRRTAAHNMTQRGVSESVAMKAGGWKTNHVFKHYNIVTDQDLVRASALLSGQLDDHDDAKVAGGKQ